MRVGVYVDGFNLYFGAREQCGQGSAGWRWLDIRSLIADALPPAWRTDGAAVNRVVYCTARVSGIDDPSTPRDQNVYLRALRASGSAAQSNWRASCAEARQTVWEAIGGSA